MSLVVLYSLDKGSSPKTPLILSTRIDMVLLCCFMLWNNSIQNMFLKSASVRVVLSGIEKAILRY